MQGIYKLLTVWGSLLLIFVAVLVNWVSMRSFEKEVDLNNKFDSPEKHQVYWHIVHNRQDIKAMYVVVFFGFAIIIALLLRIAEKLNAFD